MSRRFAKWASAASEDRKSTRLNSSHEWSSYAVFCLKKKNGRARRQTPGPENLYAPCKGTVDGSSVRTSAPSPTPPRQWPEGCPTAPDCPFFLKHPAPTDIYTLSLHDALPI